MPITNEFLTGVIEAITPEQSAAILKEAEESEKGLKINRDDVLKERNGFETENKKLKTDYAAKEADLLKQIEGLNAQIKAAGGEELKAIHEAEKRNMLDLHNSKMTELEKLLEQARSANDTLNSEYMKVLKNTELDRAMDALSNLIPERKKILRDVFWSRNNFDYKEYNGKMTMLNSSDEFKYKTIADTLTAFINTEEGKSFLLNNNTGGGAPGSGSTKQSTNNPYKKETWNFTEQMVLEKNKPELAAQLKTQAGV